MRYVINLPTVPRIQLQTGNTLNARDCPVSLVSVPYIPRPVFLKNHLLFPLDFHPEFQLNFRRTYTTHLTRSKANVETLKYIYIYSELYHRVPRIIVTTIIMRKRQNCGSLEVTLVAVIVTLHVLNYLLPDSILQAKKLLMCTATFGEVLCYCTASRHTTDDPKSSERRPST